MAVTLRNIADICEMDVSTVSRALRDDPRVQEETRKRIRACAAELGYVPNLAARNLVSGKTLNLWMIIPDMDAAVSREPARWLTESLKRQGYDLLIAVFHHDPEDFRHKMLRLSQNVADGAFIIPIGDQIPDELVNLQKNGFPLVFMDRGLDLSGCTTVTTDNTGAAVELTKRCLDAGADKFVLFFREDNSAARDRMAGAEKVLNKNKIPYFAAKDASEIPAEFLHDGKLAFLASSPGQIALTLDLHRACIPKRGLIAGVFDDWQGLTENFSHIFVCRQDFKSIAEQAAKVMLGKISSGKKASGIIRIPSPGLFDFKNQFN